MVAAPQRHPVDPHAEERAGEDGDEELVALQPTGHPDRQFSLPGQARRLPGDRIGRRRLDRRQQPLVGFRQPGRDGFGGGVPLRLRLLDLVGREIEQLSLAENRFPGQVVADSLVQILEP